MTVVYGTPPWEQRDYDDAVEDVMTKLRDHYEDAEEALDDMHESGHYVSDEEARNIRGANFMGKEAGWTTLRQAIAKDSDLLNEVGPWCGAWKTKEQEEEERMYEAELERDREKDDRATGDR